MSLRTTLARWREAFGSLLDIGVGSAPPELPESPRAGFEADHAALAGDWQRVGEDMRKALRRYEAGRSKPRQA